jgi:hypothetical protein
MSDFLCGNHGTEVVDKEEQLLWQEGVNVVGKVIWLELVLKQLNVGNESESRGKQAEHVEARRGILLGGGGGGSCPRRGHSDKCVDQRIEIALGEELFPLLLRVGWNNAVGLRGGKDLRDSVKEVDDLAAENGRLKWKM